MGAAEALRLVVGCQVELLSLTPDAAQTLVKDRNPMSIGRVPPVV